MKKTNLKNKQSGWLKTVLLLLVFLAGFAIRLYDASDAPLEFHLTRQLRSALKARDVYLQLSADANGYDQELSADLANLEVYEPPILESMVGGLYALTGSENIAIARAVNAFFWTVGGWFLYLLLRKRINLLSIIAGLTFYFFLPFSVIASRSFQPDPWMVTWILASAWAAMRWKEHPSWGNTVLTGIIGGLTVLIKGFAGLFVAPLLIGIVLSDQTIISAVKNLKVWCMAGLSTLPMAVYYIFLNAGRSGDFLSFWAGSLSRMVLTTNFYADWLAMIKGLMGLFTVLVALIALFLAKKEVKIWLLPLWIGYILFGLVFPYQFTTHEYYHLALIPLVAVGLMLMMDLILPMIAKQHWLWRMAIAGVIIASSAYNLWVSRSVLYAHDFRHEAAAWQQIADAIPDDHPFISLSSDYGMRLRYFGWKAAKSEWPTAADLRLFTLAGNADLETQTYFNEQTDGADYFLITAFQELGDQPVLEQILQAKYPLYAQGDGYMIYDLMHPVSE
ncbi:MAG: glycosyltransferase family 39 protein [Anaerolineaceae bacterium]|nr:glycosyltransferase family 39 protein [Anaerolineaceae bacterium]